MSVFRKQLQELMNQAPCGLGIFPMEPVEDAIKAYLNDTYYKIIGYTREDYQRIAAEPIDALIYKDDLEDVQKIRMQFLKDEKDESCEYRIVNKEGHIVWIKLNMTLIKVEKRKYAFTSFVDISKEKNYLIA